MPPELIVSMASASIAALALGMVIVAFLRSGELATPWTLFLGMAAFDIFLPGVVQPLWPEATVSATTVKVMGTAICLFAAGVALFGFGYWCMTSAPPKYPDPIDSDEYLRRVVSRAEAILLVAVALHASRIWRQVGRFDSFSTFLNATLTNRFASQTVTQDVLWARIESFGLPLAFLCIGILLVHRRLAPVRFGIVWPLVGLFFTFTTMFRGTVVLYLLGMITIETLHLSSAARHQPAQTTGSVWGRRRVLVVGAVVVVLAFVGYGSVRGWLSSRAWAVVNQAPAQPRASTAVAWELYGLVQGHGLVGLSRIIEQFPQRVPYMQGKTVIDMLLLPVPRAIWPSKPEWYGIDEISRRMGLTATSQSAVTMPGELYANFGPIGLPLMVVPGLVFGFFHRQRFGRRFRYLYAFQLMPLTLTSFWMSFSGFINGLIFVPVLWVVLCFMVPRPGRKPEHTPVGEQTT